jgi:hypothetical protein
MTPFYMTCFTPPGAARGHIRFTWPEGTAYSYTAAGELISIAEDLEGRGWPLERCVRFQCGIAARQVMTIAFAVDDPADVDRIEAVVRAEFPGLRRHPLGRTEWKP